MGILRLRACKLFLQKCIRVLRQRFRLWLPVTLVLLLPVMFFRFRDEGERCDYYVSRKILFKNCSGCFSVSHYPFVINQPHICAAPFNQTIDVIFVVYTRLDDVARRNLIRRTWASASRNNTSNFRYVFVLGTTSEANQTEAVRRESDRHRDIVVAGYEDAYLNLTLKTMTSLRWLSLYCGQARFFQKVDDDVWVNTRALLPILNKYAQGLDRGLGGHMRTDGRVERLPDNKWYASCKSYRDHKYPHYIHGPTYLGTLSLARRLSASCQHLPFFHMEDVFLGLCLEALGLKPFSVKEVRLWRPIWEDCEARDPGVAVMYPTPEQKMLRYWNLKHCPETPTRHCWVRLFGVCLW